MLWYTMLAVLTVAFGWLTGNNVAFVGAVALGIIGACATAGERGAVHAYRTGQMSRSEATGAVAIARIARGIVFVAGVTFLVWSGLRFL
jgi:hypothetical protein